MQHAQPLFKRVQNLMMELNCVYFLKIVNVFPGASIGRVYVVVSVPVALKGAHKDP